MFEKVSETIVNVGQALMDDYVTVVVVTPAIWMAYNQIALPDWYIASVGLIIGFYFKE